MRAFFDDLGQQRCAQLTHVSADAAEWIAAVVAQRCPQAVRCADPFHVVAWATEALDDVRRQAWNAAAGRVRGEDRYRGEGATGVARALKRSRYTRGGVRWSV